MLVLNKKEKKQAGFQDRIYFRRIRICIVTFLLMLQKKNLKKRQNPFLVLHSCCLSHSNKAFVIPLSASFEMSVSHHSFILVPLFYLMPCFTLSLTFHCECHFLTLRCFQIIHQRSPSCHWPFHSFVLKPRFWLSDCLYDRYGDVLSLNAFSDNS